jgi:hypothetical protein
MRRPNGVPAAMGAATTTQEQAPPAELLERVVEATARERYSLQEVQYMAQAASKSGMFGMTEAQAFVLMELCEAEGIHPIQAVRRYDIVDGKPAMKAATMQAEFQRRGGRIRWLERSDRVCRAEFTHPQYQPDPLVIEVTLANLTERGIAVARDGTLKANYHRTPRAMLHARTVSEGVRAIDPAIVVGLYTPEEVSDFEEPRPLRQAIAPPPVRPDPHPESRHEAVDEEPQPQPARGECSAWIQARVDETEAEWAILCASAKKPHEKLGLNPWRVINGVITDWVAKELIEPQSVLTDGKRDKSKVMEMIRNDWDDSDGEELKQDVIAYLRDKLETAAKAAGINLDAEPQEVTADA